MNIAIKSYRVVWAGIIICMLFASKVLATNLTLSINFESSNNPASVSGAEATNLYARMGVLFPSRPTIERDFRNQLLQQGRSSGRPDPLPSRLSCAPLEITLNPVMEVREVRMRVINRHLRPYTVQAFSGTVEVDRDRFTSLFSGSPPYPRSLDFRDISLQASTGEGNITRVVVNPPTDCFDLAVIDNLVLVILQDVAPLEPIPDVEIRNSVRVLAYEINQGVMSRLTIPGIYGRRSYPDTRLMVLPDKRLSFITNRDTGIRFYLGAALLPVTNFEHRLQVTINYQDGTRRVKQLTENTLSASGMRDASEPFIPVVRSDLTEDELRHLLVLRRARTDKSLDFVIPKRSLRMATSAELRLFSIPENRTLALVSINFEGPYTMGVNFLRVNGVGAAASVGSTPTLEPTRDFIRQYLEDLFPVSGRIRFRNLGVITINTAADVASCGALLRALSTASVGTGFTPPTSVEGVNYWTNMYLAQSPPGCGGFGYYNAPDALTNSNLSTAAQEVGHNIGINHATALHGEASNGAGDNELWPYVHGGIGAVDESNGFNDGVFGLVMRQTTATAGADLVNDWGTWNFEPIVPCLSANASVLFPVCSAADNQIMHDFMSYGSGGGIAAWGSLGGNKWISDINYHRIKRWFEDCRQLDPPNRFMSGGTIDVVDTTGECNGVLGTGLSGSPSRDNQGSASLVEGLVLSGTISKKGLINNFRVVRKPVVRSAFINEQGDYKLVQRNKSKSIIKTTPFRLLEGPALGSGPNKSFIIVVPYEAKLASIEIYKQDKSIFKRMASLNKPVVKLLLPKGGETWSKGYKRITWRASDSDNDKLQVFIQYSIDAGRTWVPLALLGNNPGKLDVNVKDLLASKKAKIQISVSDGLNTFLTQSSKTFVVEKNTPAKPPLATFKEDCIRFDIQKLKVKHLGGHWKIVQGSHFLFDFKHDVKQARESLAIIKRFGFDQSCFIGRPQPSMTYLKKSRTVPGGSSSGLDCVGFNNKTIKIRREEKHWLLYSDVSRIAIFPDKKEAEQALHTIKHYHLNRHCFIGRPNPSFNYWLSKSSGAAIITKGASCASHIQGKVAWNYEGNKQWSNKNIKRLCNGAENSKEPAMCFKHVMHNGVNWGEGTRWKWQNALDLCEGTKQATKTILCFEKEIKRGRSWKHAIRSCGK